MVVISDILSLENPLVKTYIFYTCVLVLKMLVMTPMTGRMRLIKRVTLNSEDAIYFKGKLRLDDDVERIRRAHQNDLENIPLFLITSGLYILTGPSVVLATTLFRAFTISRIVFTLVYAIWVAPQPTRILVFTCSILVTAYMAGATLLHFASGL